MGTPTPKLSLISTNSKRKKTLLKELEVDGGPISDQKDLSHYITKIYANFYASEAHERCWESVPTWVTKAMNTDMI
jgi:hypothetical protein